MASRCSKLRVVGTGNAFVELTPPGGQLNGADPVVFGYDGDGLILQAGALSATRDAASGRLTGTTLGSLSTTQSYNGFGELAGLTATHGSTDLYASSYTRDTLGRIETKTEVFGSGTTTFAYNYDLTGRLTQVDRDGVTVEVYTYDANGNRTSFTGPSGVVIASWLRTTFQDASGMDHSRIADTPLPSDDGGRHGGSICPEREEFSPYNL